MRINKPIRLNVFFFIEFAIEFYQKWSVDGNGFVIKSKAKLTAQ
uniref:Uncharacterized protein n=1 Tax=Methylophaga nitratireducenticrescens TaxID=754476 RepID=I1XLT9_METNJ